MKIVKCKKSGTVFETRCAKIWLEGDISVTKIRHDYRAGAEEVLEYLTVAGNITNGKPMPNIFDIRGLEWMHETGLNELLAEKSASITKASAILIDRPNVWQSLTLRVILMMSHSPFPLKAFTDREKAIEWLKQFK